MPVHYRNTPVNEPLTFDSIGSNWIQDTVNRPKGYPLYHYLQTEKGIGKIIIQGKEYILREGMGVLIAPFISHSYSSNTSEWFTSFATFIGTIENSITKILGDRQVVFVDREQGERISILIADIMKKYENQPIDVKSVSIDCYSMLMYFADGGYTNNITKDPLYIKYVQPVVKKIETHYNTELTVSELSRQVYITPQYMSRLFCRYLGCSTHMYLSIYRINKAKEFLITNPRTEVQEIAEKVGFLDSSHFIAMFKKVTGVTPLEFRKLN